MVQSLVKQRRDSIEQFMKGGRQDLVDKETAEIAVLESYLPPAADPALIDRAVAEAIAETGATSAKDMGRVMKAVMARLAGQTIDGKSRQRAGAQETERRIAACRHSPNASCRRTLRTTDRPPGPLRERGRRRDADEPRARPGARHGAGRRLWRRQRNGRVRRRVPDSQSGAGAVRRRRDERGVRADVHQTSDASTAKPTAWRLGNNVLNALLSSLGRSS